jgi:hypothetical protein
MSNSENSGVIDIGFGEDDSVVVGKVDEFNVELVGELVDDEEVAVGVEAGVGVASSAKVAETIVAPLTFCTVQEPEAPTEDPCTKTSAT